MLVKKKSGPRLIKLIAKIVFGLSIVIGLLFILFKAPFLKIKNIDIVGEGISEEELYSYLGDRVVSENILFWNPQKELESIKLSKFEIEKDFLKREIIVLMSPRKKEIVWCYSIEDSCFWVDENGLIFEQSPRLSGNLIYVVDERKAEPKKIGEYVVNKDVFNRILGISNTISKINLPISSLFIEDISRREMIAEPVMGPRIVFGLDIDPDFTEVAIESFRKSGWGNILEINLTVYGRAYASF